MAAPHGYDACTADERTWAHAHHQNIHDNDAEHYDTRTSSSTFLALGPPVQQGPSAKAAPASVYSVPMGGFLTNDPLRGVHGTVFGVVARGAHYTNASPRYSLERPHTGFQGSFVPYSQQGSLFQEIPMGQPAVYTSTGLDSCYDTRVVMNHNQTQDHWSHYEPAIVTAQSFQDTHMHAPRCLRDAGSISRSQSSAVVSRDAMHHPWSILDANLGRCDPDSWRNGKDFQSGEEVSNYSTNTYSSASSFVNGTGFATSNSSCPEPLVDRSGGYTLDRSVVTERMKDLEHETRRNNLSDEDWQQQNSMVFRCNVHEGTPSRDNDESDPVALPGELLCDTEGDYLTPHSPSFSVSSSSESDIPARTPTSSASDALCCSEPDCHATFHGNHRKGSFNRHRRLYHQPEGVKLYPCVHPSCERVFKRQDARLKHHRRRHPELGEDEPVLRPRQHETQDQVLRDISGWTGPMNDDYYRP